MISAHTARAPVWARMLSSPAELWVGVSVALAWCAIVPLGARLSSQATQTRGHTQGSHAGHIVSSGGEYPWTATWLAIWVVMVIAMMWPLTLRMATSISRASYRDWQAVCVAVSLLAFTVLWTVAGLATASAARLASVPEHSRWWQLGWLMAALAVMTTWWSARRARLLWRCATFGPLAPGGWHGIASSARVGAVTFRRCALLCGPCMAAMAVGHSMVIMMFASASAWWESTHPRRWRDPVPVVLVGIPAAWLTIALLSAEWST